MVDKPENEITLPFDRKTERFKGSGPTPKQALTSVNSLI
jgi:hypothetical protein